MKILHRLIFCYNNKNLAKLINLEANSQLEQDLVALTAINLAFQVKQLDGPLLLESLQRGAVLASDLDNYEPETESVKTFIDRLVKEFRDYRLNFLNSL